MTDQEKLSILGFMELALGRGVPFIVAWQAPNQETAVEVVTTMTSENLVKSVDYLKEKLANGEVEYLPAIPDFPS